MGKYGNNLNCCWCWRARNEGEMGVLAVGEIKLDAAKDCKSDGEFVDKKIRLQRENRQNGLQALRFASNSDLTIMTWAKKRVLKLAGGLIAKDKFKVKREKILTKGFGRSRTNPRKTLIEEVVATRSSAQCRLLTNEISGKQIQLDL